jgi:HEAT repeat protein
LPLFLSYWSDSDAELASAAAVVLRRLPADTLLPALVPWLSQGRYGALDLLAGAVHEQPEWAELLASLEAAGRGEQAAALRQRTRPGPLTRAAAAATALAGLRERIQSAPAPTPALAPALPRDELLALARAKDRRSAEQVRAALSALAKAPDAEVVTLLKQQLEHPSARVRMHAHRLLRGCVDRQQYLALTCRLLGEKDVSIRRSAIRALSHGRYEPALPALLTLLLDAHSVIRAAAEEAVLLFGKAALPSLTTVARKARPDRRAAYAALIAQIENEED